MKNMYFSVFKFKKSEFKLLYSNWVALMNREVKSAYSWLHLSISMTHWKKKLLHKAKTILAAKNHIKLCVVVFFNLWADILYMFLYNRIING